MRRVNRRVCLGLTLLSSCASLRAYGSLIVRTQKTALTATQIAPVTVQWDLNGDSVPDLKFEHDPGYGAGHIMPMSSDYVQGLNGTAVLVNADANAGASDFGPGDAIGPSTGTFGSFAGLINTFSSPAYNKGFLNADRAIGVKIPVGGEDHFGWVFVQSINNNGVNAGQVNSLVVGGWGYETTAAQPATITTAPEPGGVLCLATAAATLVRRRRSRP